MMLFVAVIATFSFASCTKDKTCSCTTTESSTQNDDDCLYGSYEAPPATTSETTWKKVKKSDAAAQCVSSTYTMNRESTYDTTNDPCPSGKEYTFTITTTTTCTLK